MNTFKKGQKVIVNVCAPSKTSLFEITQTLATIESDSNGSGFVSFTLDDDGSRGFDHENHIKHAKYQASKH